MLRGYKMRERSAHNKLSIILVAVGAVILAAIIGAAIYTGINASSGDPMPSYIKKDTSQALGTSTNPYTILEIVPDVESATVGYLINGDEPNNLLAIGATNKNDPESAAGLYASAFASASSKESEIGDYTDAYIFDNDKGSIGTVPQSGFIEKKDEYQSEVAPGSDMAYSEYGYYTKVTSGTGNYRYNNGCFEPYYGGDYTWTKLGEFKYVGFGQGNCSRLIGREYSYNNSTKTGAVGDKAYAYTYSPVGDFTFTPNNKYNNENYYAENASASDIEAATLGTNLYMTRTENVYYQYESSQIIVYDKLLEELVGQGTTGNNYATQVVTVTPRQLDVNDNTDGEQAKDIIDTADMIIVHNSATGYKIARALQEETVSDDEIPQFSSNGTSGDFNRETMNYIVHRGATANPAAIVFDEDAIQIATLGQCQYLKRLYDVYNNLGAKLAYNWMSGKQYDAKLTEAQKDSNYRNFSFNEENALGKSHFVYNYQGTDDSWLTTGFANASKINRNNYNEPAFDTAGNNTDGATMSVARMLSAINKESNGNNQPRKLRILELQPNTKYYFTGSWDDTSIKYYLDLFPWFIGTSDDIRDDITVTTMPTWEFIGSNEDPNENYDMVLIGNKEQDETNGGVNTRLGFNTVGYNDAGLMPNWPSSEGGEDKANPLAYVAVGDYITTYGGDEEGDFWLEDYDNDDKGNWAGQRTNTDEVDWWSDQYSYKWKYGLFLNSKWYNTRNIKAFDDKEYNIGFSQRFVSDLIGGGDGNGNWYTPDTIWWYYRGHNNYVYGTKHGSDANMVGLRYSGNDLTKKKYDQLMNFSKQAPLIVADDLYFSDDIAGLTGKANKYVVDESSFVYKLADQNNVESSTVHKYGNGVVQIDDPKTEGQKKDANAVKHEMISDSLSVDFVPTLNGQSALPTEYDANAAINYNQQTDGAGNNVLQYHFTLNGNDFSTYGVSLYTDSNGNGIFEGSINQENERVANGGEKKDDEKASNLIIFDETPYFKNYVTDGVLYSGHTYLVTKIMPPSDVGMIPWKLELYKQTDTSVRFSEEGYTRIRPSNNKKTTIHVLQMNLSLDMQSDPDCSVNFVNNAWFWLGSDNVPYVSLPRNKQLDSKFNTDGLDQIYQYSSRDAFDSWDASKDQYFNIEDFDIQVDYMNNTYWTYMYGSGKRDWTKELMKYDMLMVGYKDSASFTNNATYIEGFEAFRQAGKSIILTHDLVSDTTVNGLTGALYPNTPYMILQNDAKYYLREISGQMRKYYDVNSNSNDYSYMKYYSAGRKDLTFEPSWNFKIYTSIRELKKTGYGWNNLDELRPNESDMASTPVYDKYVYTYGVFNNTDDYKADDYVTNPTYGYTIQQTIQPIRDYYKAHPNKPANMIMDNSNRAMLYYNNISYYKNRSPKFTDRIDRLISSNYTGDNRNTFTWKTPSNTKKVISVNEGQITKYPYDIPDTLSVNETHTQNYQLDLEYDDDGDVLVWYDLTGGNSNLYSAREKDSRNNYYIYTKGNITYTGVGEYGTPTEDEYKLFINTMVASYRSGASDPYIIVTNQDAVNNGDNTMLYVEDRQSAGSAEDIRYRIADDTTNSKIDRVYQIFVYKFDGYDSNGYMINPEVLVSNMMGDLTSEYTIPVSYSEVYTKGEVKYKILLNSSYTDNQGVEQLTTIQRDVTVTLLPMFNMR